MTVKILDAGGEILLSGSEPDEVEALLKDYVSRGAKVVTPLSLVGRSWVAACTPPTKSTSADTTTTLNLAELAKAQARQQSKPAGEPKADGTCTIEKLGYKRLITAPTLAALQAKTQEFLNYGAGLVGEIEELDGQWIAVCDLPPMLADSG